jgi:hypothetical protein
VGVPDDIASRRDSISTGVRALVLEVLVGIA